VQVTEVVSACENSVSRNSVATEVVRCILFIEIGDPLTQQAYANQYNHFRSVNMYRDTHFSAWEGFDIPGFKEKMMTIVGMLFLCEGESKIEGC
jgi:hypothetical protein